MSLPLANRLKRRAQRDVALFEDVLVRIIYEIDSTAEIHGIWLIVAIAIAVLIIWKLGKLLFGLLANTILGFITFFLVNTFFGLGIPYDIATIVITAIFGLPGAAVIIFLKLLGVMI